MNRQVDESTADSENFVEDRKGTADLLDAQKQSLEMVVSGAPLTEVLTYLTRVVEEQAKGQAVASVLLLDERGSLHNGASPSLPPDYVKAIDGLRPDPNVGTCSAAAALRTIVITPDIASDPKWRTLKHLPLGLGFRAAWSVPILARDGRVLGTFGTYFRECRAPQKLERQAVEILARTAALAIESKLTEQRVSQSEEQLRAIFEASRDGILVENEEHIVYVNNSYAQLLGYEKPDDLIGTHISVVMSAEDGKRMLDFGRRRLRGEQAPSAYEFRGKRKDGVLIDLEASVSTHTVTGRTFITTTIRDIAERKRAETALRQANDELERRVAERTAEIVAANEMLKTEMAERLRAEQERQELLRRLVVAQEDERRRISRELHDQVGQQLTAIMLGLKALDVASHGREPTIASLQQLQELTDQLAREVHSLAWELRPPALDDLGLETALYNYAEEWAERSRVVVDFHSSGFETGRLPLTHEAAIYRIAQEALTNVSKHSMADRVSLILERRGDQVLAVVEDNGKGFDVHGLQEKSTEERNLGLVGMRERVSLLGGTLTIESAAGMGTSLFVHIPVGKGDREGISAHE